MTVLTDVALNCELDAGALTDMYLESPREASLNTEEARAGFISSRFHCDPWDRPRHTVVEDRTRYAFIGVGR